MMIALAFAENAAWHRKGYFFMSTQAKLGDPAHQPAALRKPARRLPVPDARLDGFQRLAHRPRGASSIIRASSDRRDSRIGQARTLRPEAVAIHCSISPRQPAPSLYR